MPFCFPTWSDIIAVRTMADEPFKTFVTRKSEEFMRFLRSGIPDDMREKVYMSFVDDSVDDSHMRDDYKHYREIGDNAESVIQKKEQILHLIIANRPRRYAPGCKFADLVCR